VPGSSSERRTPRKRPLAQISEWLKAQRSMPLRRLVGELNARLRGHYNDYDVIGNYSGNRPYRDSRCENRLGEVQT
jgi:hypothetical protein